MARKWLVFVAVCFAAGAGCSSQPPGRLDHDPANYARGIKKRVLEFVQEARRNPKGLSQDAAVLLETLEVHTSAPVGDYKSTYELMTKKCHSLVEAAKRSPGSPESQKLLQDMQALANQLPG